MDPQRASVELRDIASDVAQLPDDMDRLLGPGMEDIATRFAGRLRASYGGPWGNALSRATNVQGATVTVGGSTPLVSGGATGTDLLGALFGGSGRTVRAQRRNSRSYLLPVGRQFQRNAHNYLDATLRDSLDEVAEAAAAVIDPALEGMTSG